MGPLLYLIFMADIPTTEDTLIANFADDTAILSSDTNPSRASDKLQLHLKVLQTWLEHWRVKVIRISKSPLPPIASFVRKLQSTIHQYQ